MQDCRRDFPMLNAKMHGQPLTYLDTAATALTPQPVIDTINDFYSASYGTVHRAVYELSVQATARYQAARELCAGFINAHSEEEIIFTKGATDSINLVAASLGRSLFQMGDTVLVSTLAHHSNIVPWQLMAAQCGVDLRVIPVNDHGELILESLSELLCSSTKLVALSHVANAIGTAHPIKEVCRMAHEMGALVLVDGAQAVPHRPVDVQDLDCDFYAFSGHKLYGPTGIGVLYGKKHLLSEMPPYQGGGDMIESVSFEQTTYNTAPLRFEAGTPNIAGVLGLATAINYIEDIGLQNIHDHEQQLLKTATEILERVPNLHILGTSQNKGGIISFTIDNIHPLDLGTLLDLKGIAIRTGHHCAQPTMRRFNVEATARVSLGLYNTEDEITRLAESLHNIIRSLS